MLSYVFSLTIVHDTRSTHERMFRPFIFSYHLRLLETPHQAESPTSLTSPSSSVPCSRSPGVAESSFVPRHYSCNCCIVAGRVKHNKPSIVQNLRYFLQPPIQRPYRMLLVYTIVSTFTGLLGIRPFVIELSNTLQLPLRPNWILVSCSPVYLFYLLSEP